MFIFTFALILSGYYLWLWWLQFVLPTSVPHIEPNLDPETEEECGKQKLNVKTIVQDVVGVELHSGIR